MPTLPGPLTYDDYLRLSDDGRRHEIIDGHHLVNASPNTAHQSASLRLSTMLFTQIEQRGLGRVFAAPTDLVLSERDVVVPDLMVVLDASVARGATSIRAAFVEGPPDLVVEILSPSSEARDRGEKMVLYAARGVGAYWIVDPTKRTIERFRRGRDGFTTDESDVVAIGGITIDLDPDTIWG